MNTHVIFIKILTWKAFCKTAAGLLLDMKTEAGNFVWSRIASSSYPSALDFLVESTLFNKLCTVTGFSTSNSLNT